MDVTEAVSQEQVADSLLGDSNILTTVDVGRSPSEVPMTDAEMIESRRTPEERETEGYEQIPNPGEEQQQQEQEQEPDTGQMSPEDMQEMLAQPPEQDQFEQPQQQFEPAPYENLAQWESAADQVIQQLGLAPPEVCASFTNQLSRAYGVDPVSGQTIGPPNPQAITATFVKFGMNLINSVLPLYFQAPSGVEGKNQLQYLIEDHYEGISDVAQDRVASGAWNAASDGSDFANLKYGTPEFSQAMQKAEEIVEGLQWMQFPGKDGKPLPLHSKQNMQQQFKVAINSLRAGKPRVEMVKQAWQAGRNAERQHRIRMGASSAIGSGGRSYTGLGRQPAAGSDDEFFSNPASWQDYLEPKL